MKTEIGFIAGPDGVRDVHQLREVACWANDNGIEDLRGGIVKPRSSPRNSDLTLSWIGLGFEVGLPVILEGLCRHNGSFTTEVWNVNQVRDIDTATRDSKIIFHKQVGARTGPGNVIKEIGDGMADDPKNSKLVIKNQMEAGSTTFINRLRWGNESLDISRLSGVGRGHAPGNGDFRNSPNLDELLDLRKAFPDLELVVDISHTAGFSPENVSRFAEVVVKFHNQVLQETGLILVNKIMLEVDPSPALALCDRDQLLDFSTAGALIAKIRKNIEMEV